MRPDYLPFSTLADIARRFKLLCQLHRIPYQLRKIQNTSMVIISDVETGDIHFIRVRKNLIKQDIVISISQCLKDPAALAGQLTPHAHVLPTIESSR